LNSSVRYQQLGVSATKEDVHAAIQLLDKGLFPNAFCKIYPDYLTQDEDYCSISHADGAGSKSVLAYLYWKETGDLSVWKDIAQDAIVMNLDDLICVGATGPYLFSSTIGRNKLLINAAVLSALINGHAKVFEELAQAGINIHLMGGETADLGDLVKTMVVDGTMTCRMKRKEVIALDKIEAGDVIVGLASFGQTTYETSYNSGIGSNGLTAARHDTLSDYYTANYPEAYDANLDKSIVFRGQCRLTDIEPETGLTVGKLLLSPTRTYAPVIKAVLSQLADAVHGIIHCSGGGQTKVLHFIDHFHVIKDNLFAPPPVFKLIQQQRNTDWKEMYQVYNMGHRMELYVPPAAADEIIKIAASFNLAAQIIGKVEASDKKELTIISPFGTFQY
jgi:phosphoribosylformylglycinamidine cyclo-ligase